MTGVVFALTALVIVGMCAFSLDYSRAAKAKQTLQDGLDAATLAAARTTDGTWQQAGQSTFAAQIGSESALTKPTATFTQSADSVTGTATATVAPIFVDLVMRKPFDVGASTEVKRAVTNSVEVALVLDTTYSMTGQKITTLKAAAKDLVQKIKKNPKADVSIAVIPFGQYVNIGVSRRYQTWANVPADYSVTTPGKCTEIKSEQQCKTSIKTTCTSVNDGITTTYACNQCTEYKTVTYDPPKKSCTRDSTKVYKFNGCVGSPAYPKNVEDKDTGRKYPGLLDIGCGSEITPLTTTQGTAISAIEKLTPSGETYLPAGLAWGFNALSSPIPLTEAAAYDKAGPNKKPRKAVVFMTDGENTLVMDPANGKHVKPSSNKPAPLSKANDYTAELCTNIKAEGIEVYTVAFEVSNAPTKAMLQTCATDSGHFFDATDSKALTSAFDRIADSLQSIFISN